MLITPSYSVTITENCKEGVVGCDDVTYRGINRKTGKSITLKGAARMVMCADRVTPCHVDVYEFKNGAYLYSLYPDGNLVVTKNGHVIINEIGKWQW